MPRNMTTALSAQRQATRKVALSPHFIQKQAAATALDSRMSSPNSTAGGGGGSGARGA